MSVKSRLHRKETRREKRLLKRHYLFPASANCFACFQVAFDQVIKYYAGLKFDPGKVCRYNCVLKRYRGSL